MTNDSKTASGRLMIIGCGTPTPTPSRFGSSLILQVQGHNLMFDCGPGTVYKMARMGLHPIHIHHLFFTHHHYDHNVDYPCFLLCRWDHESEGVERLKVYGPSPTESITHRLIGPQGAFVEDWMARVNHPASREVYAARGGKLPRPEPRFDIREVTANDRMDIGEVKVAAAESIHLQPFLDSLAYRIDWKDGSMVVTGDTRRFPGMEDFARDVHTLVVNVWDHQENMSPTLLSGFCGTLDAAGMAASAGAQRLVITHQGPNLSRPGSREKAIADMAGVFRGEIIFGEELMSVDLQQKGTGRPEY